MMLELLYRFFVGGLIVCAFAVIGDTFTPKSFGGIVSAAPSVALATLGLTPLARGGAYTSQEGRSTVVGAAALLCYALTARWLILRWHVNAIPAAGASMAIWFIVAFGIWATMLVSAPYAKFTRSRTRSGRCPGRTMESASCLAERSRRRSVSWQSSVGRW